MTCSTRVYRVFRQHRCIYIHIHTRAINKFSSLRGHLTARAAKRTDFFRAPLFPRSSRAVILFLSLFFGITSTPSDSRAALTTIAFNLTPVNRDYFSRPICTRARIFFSVRLRERSRNKRGKPLFCLPTPLCFFACISCGRTRVVFQRFCAFHPLVLD